MSLGWAIIGTGQHPRRKMAPAIRRAADCEIVAVMSRDIGRAKQFSDEFTDGCAAPYVRLDDVLRDPRVDVVYVASPNALHATHTLAAARAGKHVLCEKPMALSLEDCERMIEGCDRAGVKLGVAFHLRNHPGILALRELIASGGMGTLALIQTTFARGTRGEVAPAPRTGLRDWWNDPEMVGAGAMVGTGVHCVDAIRFLTGHEIAQIVALTDASAPARPLEQLAVVGLRLSDETLATVCASRRLPDIRNDLVVCGSLGRATLYDGLETSLTGRLEVVTSELNIEREFESSDLGLYVPLVEMFNRWASNAMPEAFRERMATGVDGMAAVQATLGMLECVKHGKVVAL